MRMKMVRDRRKSSQVVEASVEIHGKQVAADLEKFFSEHLEEGETMPSFLIVLTLLQRLMAGSRQSLVSAAAQHLLQLDGDDKARRRRNQLSQQLESKGRRIRNVLDNLHGPGGGLEIAGLDRRSAQEPVELLAQTERIIARLSTEDAPVERPELVGFEMDPKTLVADLEPDYNELTQLVELLNREDRKVDATLIAKDDAQVSHDRVSRLVGNILASLYRLAGHEELARRVIPSTRRAGRTQSDVEAQDQEEPTSPAESEPESTEPETVG